MGLVLTGKLLNVSSRPYNMKDRETGEAISGTSHKARVGIGRGDFVDIKLTEDQLPQVPRAHEIPDDGIDVAWQIRLGFNNRPEFVGPAESVSARALKPAASS